MESGAPWPMVGAHIASLGVERLLAEYPQNG